MNKYSLLQSVQGGPFTNSSRMIDIDIPSGLIVDMTQTFVQLELSITPNAEAFTKGVSNLCLVNSAVPTIAPMNVDLFKNVYMTSAVKGKLEDVRRVNILSHNLQEYLKSTAEKISLVDSLTQYYTFDTLKKWSPFIEMRKTGDVLSAYRHNYLRIPVSHILQLGAVNVLDTNKLGACRIHLELENLSYYGLELVVNETEFEQRGPQGAADGINQGYDILMGLTYESIEEVPFFVGQYVKLSMQGFDADNNPVGNRIEADDVISKIVYDATTRKITITTGFSFVPQPDTNVVSFSDIEVQSYTPPPELGPNGSYNILTAQLGLCTVENVPASISPNEIEYLTFTTEEYNAGGQAFMNKIFELEPECVNVFLMFYNPAVPSNLLSNNVHISSYRLRIDGNDVIDRDIRTNINSPQSVTVDPLHYELLYRTFVNTSMPLSNLIGASMSATERGQEGLQHVAANQILLIACPTPMTVDTKKFQVNLETFPESPGIANVILFKQVVKVLKL